MNLRKDHYRLLVRQYYDSNPPCKVPRRAPRLTPCSRRVVPAHVHFTRDPGESHLGEPATVALAAVTSSRVQRRRSNDTGASRYPAGGLAARPGKLSQQLAGAPRNFFFITLGVSTEERKFRLRRELKLTRTNQEQFLAVDHSARASMKNAASCEN